MNNPIALVWLVVVLGMATADAGPVTPSSAWFYWTWQTEDGLPDNNITGVGQSSDGYLWVATKGGVLRFNGDEFAAIPEVNLPSLPSRAVRAMLVDHHDGVWLGMERGPILCVKPDGLGVFTTAAGRLNVRVMNLMEDGVGAVWAASYRFFTTAATITQPSRFFVVMDEDDNTVNDAMFRTDGQAIAGNALKVNDWPAYDHGGSAGISFADGHAEMHKWKEISAGPPAGYAPGSGATIQAPIDKSYLLTISSEPLNGSY